MQTLVDVAIGLTNALFVALAVTCLVRWRRRDNEPAKWAALTFGVLGLVAMAGWVISATGDDDVGWPDRVTFAVFISFPYCLYRFTAAFGPRSRRVDQAATCSWALVVVATLVLPELPQPGGGRPAWFQIYLLAVLGEWIVLSLLAATKLWRSGRGQTTVVRRRMRLLTIASVGMSVALVAGGSAPRGSEGLVLSLQLLTIAISLLTIASSLLFFAGLAPPQFLLVSWRSREEVNFDRAVQSLVAAPTRDEVTTALLPHVVALLGGRAAALADHDGRVLGVHGVIPGGEAYDPWPATSGHEENGDSVEVPLRSGRLVVWVSPYTPFFGNKELERLRSLGSLLDVALERIRLSELEEQSRRALERERAFSQFLIRSSSDGMLAFDRELRCTVWNPAMEEITGLRAADVLGKVPFHDHGLPLFTTVGEERRVRAVLEGNRTVIHERFFEAPNTGDEGWFEISYSPLQDESGTVVGGLSVVRDITQLKLAEQALTDAKDEAERANQAKSEFLSRMSHELRTPLNAILGFAQLLELEDLPVDQRQSVQHIEKAGRHLLSLINEVLEIARIEAGKLSLTLETVEVEDALQEVVGLVRPLAADRHVELHAEPSQPGHLYVTADGQRLKQVLLNLLSNAIKYNRPGGTVSLSWEQTGPQLVRITVSDTGRGIAPEMMDRLFEPFDRLGADESGVEGTGLGLALSKRLLDGMGGTLGGESELGHGSRFWLELPLARPPTDVGAEQKSAWLRPEVGPKSDGRTTTVLYIEDSALNRKLVANLLVKRSGVRLLEAMQGSMGLDLAQQHHPDLILLDLNLPDMAGMEVLRRLREGSTTCEIPVAVVSADVTKAQLRRLKGAGAHACLTKPIDVRALLAVVDEALARARQETGGP